MPERGAPTRVAMLTSFNEGYYELTHADGRSGRVMWMPARCPTCSSTANSAEWTRSRTATGSTRSRCNLCPAIPTSAAPKLDTNEDYVEDITWRFTFPVDSTGTQHVQVAELTGTKATDRNAKGRIITPPNAPVGKVLHLDRGIKIFAGPRTDPFFNYIPFPLAVTASLANGTFPDLGLPARTIASARSMCPKAAPAVVMPSLVMTIWL